MADPYGSVSGGSLKLKGVSDGKIKKKKKKKEKDMKKMLELMAEEGEITVKDGPGTSQRKGHVDKRTNAEIAFERVKQKRQEEEILEKASKTHKERIMDFNRHLDNLTEHFDIPKVSWTK